jgi:shikimate kinase
MSERPRLVLVGPPGAGKSTVGEQVARRLGLELHDTDAAIVQAQGRSISDIFVDDGEAAFRALERAEVLSALGRPEVVLSLGGGAVMDPEVQAALSGHTVVFLDVSIADAAGRVGFDASRPMLVVNPRASWMRLMQARRPVYEALATWRVDTAGRTPQQVADEVVGLLTGDSVA